MTFNMIYLCSNYPYFISYRGLCQNRKWLHCSFKHHSFHALLVHLFCLYTDPLTYIFLRCGLGLVFSKVCCTHGSPLTSKNAHTSSRPRQAHCGAQQNNSRSNVEKTCGQKPQEVMQRPQICFTPGKREEERHLSKFELLKKLLSFLTQYSKTPNSALFRIQNLGHYLKRHYSGLLLFNKQDRSTFKCCLYAYFHQNE